METYLVQVSIDAEVCFERWVQAEDEDAAVYIVLEAFRHQPQVADSTSFFVTCRMVPSAND